MTTTWPDSARVLKLKPLERMPRFTSCKIEGGATMVSTNQVEPLKSPPVTKPRARTDRNGDCRMSGVRAGPFSCQPPLMRIGSAKKAQSVPLVESSKVAREISGLAPPRSQVIFEVLKARF